jgi:hypothetical protein
VETALNAIKPDDIKNLKALKTPPIVIKIIFDGVLLLRQKFIPKCKQVELQPNIFRYEDAYKPWAFNVITDNTFLTDLQQFPKEMPFTVEAAQKASSMAVGLQVGEGHGDVSRNRQGSDSEDGLPLSQRG